MSGTFTPDDPRVSENGASVASLPPTEEERRDQAQFDAAVNRDGKVILQIIAAVAIVAALVMSTIALVLSGSSSSPARTVTQTAVAATPTAVPSPVISLSIAGGNKMGPDGKLHDSFSKTNFAVKVGQPTRLRINNTDASAHSITAPGTGVSIVVMPGVHTYTINATAAGHFEWICIIPCDSDAKGWAMSQPGYMAGYITAT
jgi:heme/copper-type cytochrome/quinol oxidase subunit 2